MKQIFLIFSIFCMAVYVTAQTDYSEYLNTVREKLEAGDCDAAQKYYNVYKELTGKTVTSMEVLLSDCGKEKTYKVGDYMKVGDEKYQVAYVRDGGKHGIAILNKGWQAIYGNQQLYVTKKGIPTLEELRIIYTNRDVLRLYDTYWTCTLDSARTSQSIYAIGVYYFNKDFSTGKEESRRLDYDGCGILLIHRF